VDPLYSISLYEGMSRLGEDFPVTIVGEDYRKAVRALKEADAVVVSVGFDRQTEKEDHDRTFALPQGQDELIEFAAEHNDNVIVVIYSGGAVDMRRWHDKVEAVLMGWYPGQEGGLAIARMLAGEISPSGRLPISIEARPEDNPAYDNYYVEEPMTKRGHSTLNVTYGEGIFVGYRGYEKNDVSPLYPFGYGLTYTSFEYSDLMVSEKGDGVDVTLTVTNTGNFDAAEVVQIYVGEDNPCVARPAKELKGYDKVFIPKGESAVVTVRLPRSAFAFYDVDIHDWRINPGSFTIMVGASSQDIKLKEHIIL
jgi:beta-glucosidase